MNRIKSIGKNKTFLCALVCFSLAFLSFIIFIIQGDGFFIVRDDFNEQQIPFTVGLHQSITDSGIDGFSWCVDLGTSTLQAYSFYELGSPFFWISMLFPAQLFPYIVGWIYMLKYTVAGVFAFLYLKRFLSDDKWAILGAVLYAFSGFSTVNLMYYHFHDVIALFPLLLIGLELLIEKKDFRLFTFAVFLNAFLNYFFFIGEAIFLIIYYLFRFSRKDIMGMAKEIGSCIASAVLGVGMAAVLFIPSILYIMQNSRSQSNFSSEALFNNLRYILFNLKGLILPAESMPDMSAIFPSKFYSTAAYLPMVGLVFVFAYIIKNRNWLSRLLIFCLIGAFWPLIGNAFFLFMDSQNRWWHCLVLIMALASCYVLENASSYKKEIVIGGIINLALIAFLFIMVWFIYRDGEGATTVYSSIRFIVYTGVAFAGVLCCLFTVLKGNYKLVICAVSAFAVLTTSLTLYVYRANGKDVSAYRQTYDLACQISLPDDQYRINDGSNIISMVGNISGFSLFTSTDSTGISEFESLFDYSDAVNGLNKNTYTGLSTLLGGKYYLTTAPDDNNTVATYESNGTIYYLQETYACPIGFALKNYISKSELASIPVEYRAIALMQAIVVDDDFANTELLSNMNHVSSEDIVLDISIEELAATNTKNSVSNFEKDGNGFTCNSDFTEETTIYFSVPYDKGWSATIDGVETEVMNSGGMIIISVPAGSHSIEFQYVTPGFKIGLYITCICIIAFLLLCLFKRVSRH